MSWLALLGNGGCSGSLHGTGGWRNCLVLAKGMPEATPRVVRPLLTEEDVARIAELSEVLDGESDPLSWPQHHGFLLVALLGLFGCQGPQKKKSVVPKAQQSWEDREQLTKLHRSGVCELRWIDEAGRRHFEPQVDCDLWQPPSAFATQQIGEILGWVGGDGNRFGFLICFQSPPS